MPPGLTLVRFVEKNLPMCSIQGRALRHAVSFLGLLVSLAITPALHAQPSATNALSGTPEQQIATLRLQLTNAWMRVVQIVNQPVTAYGRRPGMHVSVYSPGWFHQGANTPDFNNVDIRQTQDLNYATHEYVSSDLNPGICFLGKDLEFNANTKLFYANRSLPKHKLTEAEMLQINQLYRTIGHCQDEIARLQNPAPPAATGESQPTANDAGEIVPGQSFEAIRKIPKETRVLYGGIAIGVLVLLLIVFRMVKGRG